LLEEALKYTDDFADVYNLIGMEYLFMDNLELAKENFIRCLEEDPEDQSGLYNVVYCFEFLDQNQDAIDYLNKYIDQNPYSEIAWHQIGRLSYGLKNYEEAIRAFDYATYIDDEFVGAYMEKAKAYERLKRYEDAIESYALTIELEDATSYALLRTGKCYEKLDNKEEALKYYNKTVHEDPLLDKGWIAITDFYVRQKNYEKALYFVNKALGIDNLNRLYWKRFATINSALGKMEEAEFGYRKAVEYGDSHLDTWIFLIDILIENEEYKSCIETLLQASEFFTDEYEIEYRLAGLYFILDDEKRGTFHLVNAFQHSFKNRTILQELFPMVWDLPKVQKLIIKKNR
jgi:tetratricopeptide (TPR) repeat protein